MNAPTDNNTQDWYVMCHLNPMQIETLLKKDSKGEFRQDGPADTPYSFYIPYLHMPTAETLEAQEESDKGRKAYDSIRRNKELRGDLFRFVFIQAPEERVWRIVSSPWNTGSRLRLYHYRDHEGKKVIVRDGDMRRLMTTIRDQHFLFYFDQPITDFQVESEVILNIEPWKGHRGVIKKITCRKKQLCMDISMNIFNRTRSINFVDLKTGDISFVDAAQAAFMEGDFLSHFEEELMEQLSHLHTRSVTDHQRLRDAVRLKQLSTYYNIYMDDEAEQPRFLALRLIYATLRKWDRHRETLVSEAQALLSNPKTPATDAEAYLMTALFIATRLAPYRDAVKRYRAAHPDSPDILRRYHTITKHLKAKR